MVFGGNVGFPDGVRRSCLGRGILAIAFVSGVWLQQLQGKLIARIWQPRARTRMLESSSINETAITPTA
jgi:hypothetical protein